MDLPEVHGTHHRHHRSRRASSPEAIGVGADAAARAAGDLVVAGHQPAAARRRLRRLYYGWGNLERDPNPTRDLIRVVEQCADGCAANGSIPGLVYRSQDFGTNYTRLVHLAGIGLAT